MGVEVLSGDDVSVQIWQINSKGKAARCYITVPRDKIGELIRELQMFDPNQPRGMMNPYPAL